MRGKDGILHSRKRQPSYRTVRQTHTQQQKQNNKNMYFTHSVKIYMNIYIEIEI